MNTAQVKEHKRLYSHLKNSFFSSSTFKVRLFRKSLTSRKSFLFKKKNRQCSKHRILPKCWRQQTQTLTWRSHEPAGSWVGVAKRGQSSAGPPAGSLSDCRTAPVTLKQSKKWDEEVYLQAKPARRGYEPALLTTAIQERDQGLHRHAKRVTVPGVSVFIRKHFKVLNLSMTCLLWERFYEKGGGLPFNLWPAYLLFWRNAAGFPHITDAGEKLRSWKIN